MANPLQTKDHWDAIDYQHSASFVPQLADKITQWLDLQKDDIVLDIGCGDGVLDLKFAMLLARGKGSIHGLDSSDKMIAAARALCKDQTRASFEVWDCSKISGNSSFLNNTFTKVFSNAAMHWILRNESTRESFFRDVFAILAHGGKFIFEMGGLGNVAEMRAALVTAASRRIGMEATKAANPWFFPDEAWVTEAMEKAGFRVDRIEREWRPTKADKGGVGGWVRLFGRTIIEAVPEEQREAVIKEVTETLKHVCSDGRGGEMISYVRLRALATKP